MAPESTGCQPDEPLASLVTTNKIVNVYGFLVVILLPMYAILHCLYFVGSKSITTKYHYHKMIMLLSIYCCHTIFIYHIQQPSIFGISAGDSDADNPHNMIKTLQPLSTYNIDIQSFRQVCCMIQEKYQRVYWYIYCNIEISYIYIYIYRLYP